MHQSQEGNTEAYKYEETGKKRHQTHTCDQCVKRGIVIVSSSAENVQKLSSDVRAESSFPSQRFTSVLLQAGACPEGAPQVPYMLALC